eukprot:gene9071-8189_t
MLDEPVADVADVSAMFTAINRETAFAAVKLLVADIKNLLSLDNNEQGYILLDEELQ